MVDGRDRGELMRRGRLLYAPPVLKVQLHNQTVANAGNGSSAVTAIYRISSNGRVLDQSSHVLEAWLLSGTVPNSGYDARATLLSGTVGGTFGTWLNVGGSPGWSCSVSRSGTQEGQIKVELRDAATLAVLVSAIINLSADFGN